MIRLLLLLPIVIFFSCYPANAQVVDDFADGNFSNNPTWSGMDTSWIVDNFRLRSKQNTPNFTFYLSTPSTKATNAQWEFWTNLQFNTSGANYVDVFLTSDSANLRNTRNGYFLRIGGTQDKISLWRRLNNTDTTIIDGTNGVTNFSNNTLRIKVTRDAAHLWKIEYDNTGGTNYMAGGTVTDTNLTTSSFFGVLVRQSTATFHNKHFFDDFYVGNILIDTTPPALQSVTAISQDSLLVVFDEAFTATSAQNTANYSVNNGIGNPSNVVIVNPTTVKLRFSTNFNSGQPYILSVSGITDLVNNSISTPATEAFVYTAPVQITLIDNFADGDFTNNPAWSGIDTNWVIDNFRLRSNAATPNYTFYLSTPYTKATNAQWEFWTNLQFNTSGANYVDVFLTSDSADLRNTRNGYFLRIGDTQDDISLWRRLNNANTKIIDGTNGVTNFSNNTLRIKVTRDTAHLWKIEYDNTGGTNYMAGGTVTDTNLTTSSFFGVLVRQSTATFHNKHFFDDFYAGAIIPDTVPPLLQSVTVLSADSLQLVFNEDLDSLSAISTTHYSVNGSIGHPNTIVWVNAKTVKLAFATPFNNGQTYTIAVTNVKDVAQNAIVLPQNSNFIYVAPYTPQFRDIVINEIMYKPSPVVGLPNAEFVELYNTKNFPIDVTGWRFSDASSTVTLGSATIPAKGYLVLCSSANVAAFQALGITNILGVNLPALNDSGDDAVLRTPSNQTIDALSYTAAWHSDATKSVGGWTIEQRNPLLPCSGITNWGSSLHPFGGTPAAANSILDTTPDTTPPTLLSTNVVNDTTLIITFNEGMDTISLLTANYQMSGFTFTPKIVNGNVNQVQLRITPAIQIGIFYTLKITGVRDCSGNLLVAPDTTQFGIGQAPLFGEVVINEILADESPQVGLPLAEFVEILNVSNKLIDLKDCRIANRSSSAIIPATLLRPNEYLILTKTTAVADYSLYGRTLGVPSMPSLTNSGDNIAILNPNQQIVSFVNYTDRWYEDEVKRKGGWSLERINPSLPCGNGQDNWKVSTHFLGGTPGLQNSRYALTPDTKAPSLLSVEILNQSRLLLTFSETLDSLTIYNAIYDIQGGTSVSSITTSFPFEQVELGLNTPIANGVVYRITINNMTDCAGNSVAAPTNSLQFGIGERAKLNEIIITEIMADETPAVQLPESEYIEIYNPTQKIIDLSGCLLIDGSGTATLPNLVLLPQEYAVLTKTSTFQDFLPYGKAIGVTSFPSLANSGEALTLRNPDKSLIFHIVYSIDWYKDEVKKNGGWSLEMIDVNNPCGGINNWTASVNSSGGTPAQSNSVATTNGDNMPPKLLNAFAITENQVRLVFDETIDSISAVIGNIASKYQISDGISITAVAVNSLAFNSVILTIAPALQPRKNYTATVLGVSDCKGNLIGNDNQVQFALPEQAAAGDVLLNEILFNPPTGGVDYVELYNNSDKFIDLMNWKIANLRDTFVITQQNYTLAPRSYVLLTTSSELTLRDFPRAGQYIDRFLQIKNMPSYNNTKGNVILINNLGESVERFDYTDKFHTRLLREEKGVSLERIAFNLPTNTPESWQSAAQSAGFGTPAYRNSQNTDNLPDGNKLVEISPKTFTPDEDGDRDFALIQLNPPAAGYVANVIIYDSRGREIRRLVRNESIGSEAIYRWDGTDKDDRKAPVGAYLLWVEITNISNGDKKVTKETLAIGAKF